MKQDFIQISVIVLFGLYFAYFNTRLPKVEKTHGNNVFHNTKHEYTEQLPTFWLYVNIKNSNIEYTTNFHHANYFWQNRANTLLNAISILSIKDIQGLQGKYLFSLEDGVKEEYSIPILAFAAKKNLVDKQNVFLIPDYEALQGYENLISMIKIANLKYPWTSKENIILWRGSANGGDEYSMQVDSVPRLKFMHIAQNYPFINAGITSYQGKLNSIFIKQLEQQFPIQPKISPADSLKYRYLLDIDGHSCSYSRMAWILSSSSILLKHQSDFIQWYYYLLEPYKHYIPLAADFSDLELQMSWMNANSQKLQEITNNAQILANSIFNRQSIVDNLHSAMLRYKLTTQITN